MYVSDLKSSIDRSKELGFLTKEAKQNITNVGVNITNLLYYHSKEQKKNAWSQDWLTVLIIGMDMMHQKKH